MLSKQILRPDLNRLFLEKDTQQFASTLTALHWLYTAVRLHHTCSLYVCDPVAAILVFSSSVTETCPLQC